MEKPKLIMLIGLPASGKTIHAKKLSEIHNANIHSSDDIRIELFDDVNNQDGNSKVFQTLHSRVKNDLINSKNTIIDATNISYKKRMNFLQQLKNIDCFKKCYLIATPYEKCIQQNNNREKKVPIHVITRMYKNINIPQYYEGWDDISIIWNMDEYRFNDGILFKRLREINQNNPHHTLTIGCHCEKCLDICTSLTDNKKIRIAAVYHDIGKEFCKSFKNKKGEITEKANYYQHHLVSAYNSLFHLTHMELYDILEITNYIQWHMQPFFSNTQKSINKYKNLLGEKFWENLLILHEADVNAK
jgi:predicted kinase